MEEALGRHLSLSYNSILHACTQKSNARGNIRRIAGTSEGLTKKGLEAALCKASESKIMASRLSILYSTTWPAGVTVYVTRTCTRSPCVSCAPTSSRVRMTPFLMSQTPLHITDSMFSVLILYTRLDTLAGQTQGNHGGAAERDVGILASQPRGSHGEAAEGWLESTPNRFLGAHWPASERSES